MINIVLIAVDQMRADIAYHEAFNHVRTPHLDRLRREGVTFRRAFCQYPVCGPSRASLMTGRYPAQTGVLNNRCMLPPTRRTLADHFVDLGYEAVAVGKTHGQNPGFRRIPEPAPFERVLGSNLWGFYHGQDMLSPTGAGVPELAPQPLLGVYEDDPANHYDHTVNRQARDFLDGRSSERPFLLWVGYHGPHPPLYPPGHLADLYPWQDIPATDEIGDERAKPTIQSAIGDAWRRTDDGIRRRMIAAYLALVTHVDECLGELLASLETRDLLEDTLVVFLSDHGEQLGQHGMIGKFNNFYDASVRTPLVMRLPGQRHAGLNVDAPVELVDVYPTVCDVVGVATPRSVRGVSLVPALNDPTRRPRPFVSCMLVEQAAHSVAAVNSDRSFVRGQMVRTERWKLALYTTGEGELYDLETDPNEYDNRFADPALADIRETLSAHMVAHLLTATRDPAMWGANLFPG